ncbi:MAG TPA: hypothetical protein PK125_11325 [Syntrophorhabdus sp.]|jgi:hypothetical protein|nr:hypothetical protein [Syntrophorhabdus sp.]
MKGSIIARKIGLLLIFITFSFSAFSQKGPLKVGAARVNVSGLAQLSIVPPTGKYTHEDLFVRAIVLDNGATRAVLISIDGNIRSEYDKISAMISRELNCPVENILLSGTHSHSAGLSESDEDAIIEVVKKAEASLRHAQVGFGEGKAWLNVNRDAIDKTTRKWTQAANPDGPSDKTVAVMLFTDFDGNPIAGYMNYAMHPVNGYVTGIRSADYPGAACRHIEMSFGDDMVMMFTQGASGDQNPLWLRPGTNVIASRTGTKITGYEMTREVIESPLRDYQIAKRRGLSLEGMTEHGAPTAETVDVLNRWIDALGMILGEEAIRVMTNINDFQTEVKIRGARETLMMPGRVNINKEGEFKGEPGVFEDGPDVNVGIGVLGIGNIALANISAEIYNIFGQKIKAASPLSKTIFVTLTNGGSNSGYIIDDASYNKNTFQVLGNKIQPGHAETKIVESIVKLIEKHVED